MDNDKKRNEYYHAFVKRDSNYEGIFFAAIRTTGIFCRPTCSARQPKIENCEFFDTAQKAILAGYRPCKRCHPTGLPNEPSSIIKTLIEAVENAPSKRWNDSDVRRLNIDPSTARRQFKNRFGMTFIAYARARRIGISLQTIRTGDKVIHAQIDSGYESGSGFRDAFTKIMGVPPSTKNQQLLYAEWIDTPLGAMLALADDAALHLVEFTDRRGLEAEVIKLRKQHNYAIVPGKNAVTISIQEELRAYLDGTLTIFSTPIKLYGSVFQHSVLRALQTIPYGETRSYKEQAEIVHKPTAIRAVARANGQNQLAIIVPCHRVIGTNGSLTGYAGGLPRKKWLLEHEAKNITNT